MVITLDNCRICREGQLVHQQLSFSSETGLFVGNEAGLNDGQTITLDLNNRIVAPGFLELQINGLIGFHFTHFKDSTEYAHQLAKVAAYLASKGVTGFWVTIPTVSSKVFKQILPELKPRAFSDGADLLGAHAEGPFLHPAKKGAHNEELIRVPEEVSAEDVYGIEALQSSVKMVTVAPELPGAPSLIAHLRQRYSTVVSLGHSSSSYEAGVAGVAAGATALTHLFNAMNPWNHRAPGLAGLIALPVDAPYYSIIADGVHLHEATVAMAFRAQPERCMLITDAVELGGLPDGVYPGHAQIPQAQRKHGSRVTMAGSDTLIGGCASLDECLRNLVRWSGCGLAEGVRCVTENVASLMHLSDRGRLRQGCRADFVILDDGGHVLETWIAGHRVWRREQQQQQQQEHQ